MNKDGTGFYTCKECHQTESLSNHITTDHREGEQLEDRRNDGENSSNSGDGTDRRIQSLMFIMMIMGKPDRLQMTIRRMRVVCWIARLPTHFRVCYTYCFCTATVVTPTLLIVTLYLYCSSCFVLQGLTGTLKCY